MGFFAKRAIFEKLLERSTGFLDSYRHLASGKESFPVTLIPWIYFSTMHLGHSFELASWLTKQLRGFSFAVHGINVYGTTCACFRASDTWQWPCFAAAISIRMAHETTQRSWNIRSYSKIIETTENRCSKLISRKLTLMSKILSTFLSPCAEFYILR